MVSNEMLVFHKAKTKNYFQFCRIKCVFMLQKLRIGKRERLGLNNTLTT